MDKHEVLIFSIIGAVIGAVIIKSMEPKPPVGGIPAGWEIDNSESDALLSVNRR